MRCRLPACRADEELVAAQAANEGKQGRLWGPSSWQEHVGTLKLLGVISSLKGALQHFEAPSVCWMAGVQLRRAVAGQVKAAGGGGGAGGCRPSARWLRPG